MFGNPDGSRALGITILSSSQKLELEREFRKDSRLGAWEKGELAVRIGGSRNDVPLMHLWFIVRRRVERYHAPKGLISRRDDAIRVLRSLVRTPETIRELDLQLLNERLGKDFVHPPANQTRKNSSSSPTQSVFSSAWSKLGAASKPSRSTSLANDLTATRFNLPRLSKPRRVSNGIIHVHNSVIKSIPNDLPQTVLPPGAEQRPRRSSLKGDAEIPSLADMMKADIKDVRRFSTENYKPARDGGGFASLEQPHLRRCSTDLADKRLSVATTVNSPELESMYAFHKKGRRRTPHLHEIVSQHAAQKARPEVQVASVILPAQTQAQPLIPGSDLPAPLHKLHLERMASMSSHMEHAMKRDKRSLADQKIQRLSLDIPGANGERRRSIEKVQDWMANNVGDEFMSLGPSFVKQEPTRHYSIHSNMSSRTLTDSNRGSILFDEGYHSRGSWSTDHTLPFQEAVLTMLQKPAHPLATSEIPSPLDQTGPKNIFNAQKEKSFNFIVPLMQSPQLNHLNLSDKAESDSTLPEKLQRLPPLDLDKAKMERRTAAHEPMLSPKSPAPPLNDDGVSDDDDGGDDNCSRSSESETPDGSMYSLWSETSHDGLDLTAFLPKSVLNQITDSFLKSFAAYKLRHGIQGCQMTPDSSSPCPTQGQQSSKAGKKSCGKKSNERKRKRGNEEDGDQDERRRPFDSHRSESDAEGGKNERSFACPYCKWKPVTYGNCQDAVLKEISRVKQHLFRKHVGPVQCVHCYAEFRTSELRDAHLLQRSCTTLPRRTMEYMTEDMQTRIKRRVDPKKTKSEQWYEIYAILFPNDPVPKDPYLDEVISAELTALEAFAREEFPQLAETIISEHLPAPLRHQEQVLRSFLPWLIEQGFHNLLRRFEEQRGPRPDAPQTAGLIAEHSPSFGPASDSGISTTPPQGSFNRLGDSWSMANLQTPPVTTPGSTSTVNWQGNNRSFIGRVQARTAASAVDSPWPAASQGGSQNFSVMGGSPMENPWSFQESASGGIGLAQGMFQDTSMTDPSSLQQQDVHISNQGTDMLSVNMDTGASNFLYSFNDPSQGLRGNGNDHGNGGQFFGQHGFGGMN